MTSSESRLVKLKAEAASGSENQPSRWFLLEVEAASEAEEALLWLLTDSLSKVMPGIRSSTQCSAQSMAEALAEFARLGECEQHLHLRLVVRRVLD